MSPVVGINGPVLQITWNITTSDRCGHQDKPMSITHAVQCQNEAVEVGVHCLLVSLHVTAFSGVFEETDDPNG